VDACACVCACVRAQYKLQDAHAALECRVLSPIPREEQHTNENYKRIIQIDNHVCARVRVCVCACMCAILASGAHAALERGVLSPIPREEQRTNENYKRIIQIEKHVCARVRVCVCACMCAILASGAHAALERRVLSPIPRAAAA